MYTVLTAEDRQRMTVKAIASGCTKTEAEDMINLCDWVGINHKRLSLGYSMTIAVNNQPIPFVKYCSLLWNSKGREEYHEKRQAVLN